MKTQDKHNQQQLMKYFSLVLKRRATNAEPSQEIDTKVLNLLTRKDLVDIITYRYQGELPKDVNLVAMENEDLLQLIKDELYIITYMTQQWCTQLSKVRSSRPVHTPLPKSSTDEK